MIPLTFGIAIPDAHAWLAHLQTNTLSCHTAAFGTAEDDLIHGLLILIRYGE
jgi:hypothetical protein